MRSHLTIALILLPGLTLGGCGQPPNGNSYDEASNGTSTPVDAERYAGHAVNPIHQVADMPVSTFAVDVDSGAYANVRRMLLGGQDIPAGAVRTEEMINYFRYDYPLPDDRSAPFNVTTAMSTTPWSVDTRLLRIGLRSYDTAFDKIEHCLKMFRPVPVRARW